MYSFPGSTFELVERCGTSNFLTILCASTSEAPAVLAERYTESNHGALKKEY